MLSFRQLDGAAPLAWTSWRDVRDGTVVTVVRTQGWDGPYPGLRIEVDAPQRIRRVGRKEFEENFEPIYDPYTGWEVNADAA